MEPIFVLVSLEGDDRVVRARAMRAAGASVREIMAEFGMRSESAVRLWLDDELRARSLERRREKGGRNERGGACIDCGAATTRGRLTQWSVRCANCRNKHLRGTKKAWTREAIIGAIQRFATANGRPPTKKDFHHANHELGYPAIKSVYRAPKRQSPPFATFEDAIVASGFPRPVKPETRKEARKRSLITRYQHRKDRLDERIKTLERFGPANEYGVKIPDDVARHVPPEGPVKRDLSVQELLESFDCQAYGCVRDTEPGRMFCRVHLDGDGRRA